MSERIALLREPPDAALAARLEALIGELVGALDEAEDGSALLAEINALSGLDYDSDHFFELYGWSNERDAALVAAKGPPPMIPNLTREELVEIARILDEADEPDISFFAQLLDRSLPDPFVNAILNPHRDMTNDEAVDELLRRWQVHREGGAPALRADEQALAREVASDPAAPFWAQQWARSAMGRD